MDARLAEKQPSSAASLAGKRILVLEDRLVNQVVIQEQLKKLGLDFMLAANGVEALEILQTHKFDLVLCDCSMPEMDGFDFTRTLRRQELSGQRMPVVALTANDSPDDANESAMAGMDDFLSKPVTADRLAAVLVKWLDPSATIPAAPNQARSDPGVTAPAINLRLLAEILGTNEVETLHQVLKESLTTVGASLSEVEAAANSGDPGRLTSAVRNAKGEARCVAALGLANIYAKLEQYSKDSDRVGTRDLIARATSEVRQVEGFIRSYLGSRA